MLSELQARFLEGHRVAYLATTDPRARPHVVPVCFVLAERCVYTTIDEKPKRDSRRSLQRVRNIEANPDVAFMADRYDEDWSRLAWIMLRGKAEILESGPEHDYAQRLLCERYPQYQGMEIGHLPVIAIRIERVNAWGCIE